MKVFIDLGAYKGDTVKEFMNWIQLIDYMQGWDIYAFEPNPDLENQNIINAKKNGYVFEPWAAWTSDGEIELAIDKTETPMGSTVMKSKTEVWNKHPHVMVKSFDFSKWLTRFKLLDKLIVKMDIEGAEFPILRKMIDDGTITKPDILLVEFHANKVRAYTSEDKDKLIADIKEAGGNLKLWH